MNTQTKKNDMKPKIAPNQQRHQERPLRLFLAKSFGVSILISVVCLTQSCTLKSSSVQRIEQALEYDMEIGKRYMDKPESDSLSLPDTLFQQARDRRAYVSAMESYLSNAKLPNDIRDLFLDHLAAHSEAARVEETFATEIATKGGTVLSDLMEDESADGMGGIFAQGMIKVKDAYQTVSSTYDLVRRRAIQYGAKVPMDPDNQRQ